MIEENKLYPKPISDENLQNVCGGISDAQYEIVREKLNGYVTSDDFDSFVKYTCQACSLYGDDTLNKVINEYTASGFLSTMRATKLAITFSAKL